jgi:hypothetical protein
MADDLRLIKQRLTNIASMLRDIKDDVDDVWMTEDIKKNLCLQRTGDIPEWIGKYGLPVRAINTRVYITTKREVLKWVREGIAMQFIKIKEITKV